MPRASQSKKKSKGVSKGPSVTVAPLEKSMAEVAEDEWEKVDVEEEVKKKPIRVKTSSFHITINSNQRYGSKDAFVADLKPFYGALKALFENPEHVKAIVDIMNPNDVYDEVVGSVNTDIGFEYSPVAGMHAHCLITLAHVTKLRIDIPRLRWLLDALTEEHGLSLQGDAPYVHVRFVPDQKQVVKNYIHKTVHGSQFRMRDGVDFNVPMGACACKCEIGDMSSFFS